MNPFDKLESEGRQLFQELLLQRNITTGKPSENPYDCYDYSYQHNNRNIAVEIKKRDQKYLNYDTHFMEVSKFNSLIELLDNKQYDQIIYANFFGENIAYLYNLNAIRKAILNNKIIIREIACNKTTAIYQGKKLKKIIEIPLTLGVRFEKSEGKWIRIN